MILFRLVIALLTIQYCLSQSTQWIVTHHEGQNSNFNQFQSDIGIITECQHSKIQIITSNPFIQKTISLRNFKPFAHTLIVIDYLIPETMDVQIQIQNKTYDPRIINPIYKRSKIDTCIVGDIQYIEQSFVYEIFGNSLEELNIFMMGGKSNDVDFNMTSDQKIAIKQIHLFQIQCPEYCKRCVYLDNQAICTLCNDGFESNYGSNCICNGFRQNDICVEKCYDGYVPDQYNICQQIEIIKSIRFEQNLRKIYKINEILELEFNLDNFRTFEIDIEVIIYNFDILQVFQILMNDGLIIYYLNIDSPNNVINLNLVSYKDCESEQYCQIFHFKSKIITTEQSKLNFLALLNEKSYKYQQNIEDQKTFRTYWKLISLNINLLMIQHQIPYFEDCQEIAKFGYLDKCIKCQSPYIVFNGYCVEKCPILQLYKNDDICFDSEILIQVDLFTNQNYYLNEKYWFYNKEQLFSSLQSKIYQQNSLPTHYGITIQAKILFIDSKKDSNITITFGDHQIIVTSNNQEYISNSTDSFIQLNQFIPHNNTNLFIEIQQFQEQSYLTNFILLIHKCTPYCKLCTGPKKSECLQYETDLNNSMLLLKNVIQAIFKQKENNV